MDRRTLLRHLLQGAIIIGTSSTSRLLMPTAALTPSANDVQVYTEWPSRMFVGPLAFERLGPYRPVDQDAIIRHYANNMVCDGRPPCPWDGAPHGLYATVATSPWEDQNPGVITAKCVTVQLTLRDMLSRPCPPPPMPWDGSFDQEDDLDEA